MDPIGDFLKAPSAQSAPTGMLMPPVSGTESPDMSLFDVQTEPQQDNNDPIGAFLMAPPINPGNGSPPPSGTGGEDGSMKRFAKGALEGIGQAGIGIGQIAVGLLKPQTFGEAYSKPIEDALTNTVDASRARVNDMGTAGMIGQVAGNVAGSLPFAPLGAAKAAPAVSTGLSRIGGAALLGAKEGATQGMGTDDSALTNAAIGAGTAGALTGLVPVVKGAANAAQTVGNSAKTAIVGKKADEVIADIVARSGMSPDELLQHLQGGQITNLADVAGDSVQGLTRSVAKTAGGKDIVSNELAKRAEGTSKRITQDINQGISKNTDYFGSLEDLATKRSEQAGPLYQQAYAANKSIASPEVDKILATPAGRKALGDAVSIMQNDRSLVGVPTAELGEQARLAGLIAEGGVAEGLNLRTLDYVKKALDDQINTLQRAGENSKAAVIVGLKKDLVKELDAADVTAKAGPKSLKPEGGAYAQARKVASDTYRLEEAQTMGRDFDKIQPQEITKQLEGMGPAELDAYKIGVRQKLQQTVAGNSDNGSSPRKIFGNDLIRDKVRAVFGKDAAGYDKFAKRMEEEIRANKTNQRVLGGSRTDFNIDADSDFGDILSQLPKKGLSGTAIDATLGKLTDFVSKRYYGITEANSKAIAKALVNREEGIKALQKLLANQINKNSLVSQAAKQAITAIQGKAIPASTAGGNTTKIRIPVRPNLLKRKP